MRGAPGDLELEPDEPLVRDDELELGRLGHDGGVRAHRLEDVLDPEARVLLVRHRGDDDIARETQSGRIATGDQSGGDPGLHVVRAASVEPVALDPRCERLSHAVDSDRVEVPAEQERAAPAGPPGPDDDARSARLTLDRPRLETVRLGPARRESRHFGLARSSRHERWVDRIDRDERGEQTGQVVHCSLG